MRCRRRWTTSSKLGVDDGVDVDMRYRRICVVSGSGGAAGGVFTFREIKDETGVGATPKRQTDHSCGRALWLTSLLPSVEEKWLNPRYAKFRCRHPAAVRAAGMDFEGLVGGCALFCARG